MQSNKQLRVAIFGGGLIGSSWALIFSSNNHVVVYDVDEERVQLARKNFQDQLQSLDNLGCSSRKPQVGSIAFRCTPTHFGADDWLKSCHLVMECVPEKLEMKCDLFGKLDEVEFTNECILCSSSSCLPASTFTETLKQRERCLITHPVNPPTLLPLVEIVPAPWTSLECVQKARNILNSVGQRPIVLKKEILGFAVNRLQYSLIRAAVQLVEEEVMDPEDVDLAITEGLGPRYAVLGPFAVTGLNAVGGYRGYLRAYGDTLRAVLEDMGTPMGSVKEETNEQIAEYVNRFTNSGQDVKKHRDTMLAAISLTKDALLQRTIKNDA